MPDRERQTSQQVDEQVTTSDTSSGQQTGQSNTTAIGAMPSAPNDGGGLPTTLAAVQKMTRKDVESNYSDATSARPLLKQVFNSDWFVAKAALVRDKWPGAGTATDTEAMKDLMKKFLALRAVDTDNTLKGVRDVDVMDLPLARGLDADQRLEWGSAGSESLTSDIDINLKGYFNTQAVELFNKRFLTEGWGFEAGIVYDVNVYAKDFMSGFDVSVSPDDPSLGLITPENEVELSGDDADKDAQDQEIWSLVKLRRYMKDGEWTTYTKSMLGDPPDKDKAAQFKEVEVRYSAWKKALEAEVANIQPTIDKAIQELEDGGTALSSHDKSDIADMAASNRIYEEQLKNIIQLRSDLARVAKLPKNPSNKAKYVNLALELRTRLSEAAMFANEAYITDGAVNHVVVGVQIGGSAKFLDKQKTPKTDDSGKVTKEAKLGSEVDRMQIQLPVEQFLHSFNEQLADAIKELGHYPDTGEAFYQGGKYVQRMALAVDRLPNTKGVKHLAGFRSLGDEALALKKNDKLSFPKKFEGVRKACNEHIKTSDNAAIRKLLVQFGIDVTKAYRGGGDSSQTDTSDSSQEQQVQKKPSGGGGGGGGGGGQDKVRVMSAKVAALCQLFGGTLQQMSTQ